nr:hypothetical protein SHINE37_40443 [Rhizobiaceae bacterium]
MAPRNRRGDSTSFPAASVRRWRSRISACGKMASTRHLIRHFPIHIGILVHFIANHSVNCSLTPFTELRRSNRSLAAALWSFADRAFNVDDAPC